MLIPSPADTYREARVSGRAGLSLEEKDRSQRDPISAEAGRPLLFSDSA